MASKGIYTALSGAMAQGYKLDTIANNIANAQTAGFKGDQPTFEEHLSIIDKAPDVITVPRIPASIESFYDMEGTDKSYVALSGNHTDFGQGGLKATGNSLDIALNGKGFIEVLTPQGPRLTRKGSFSISPDGFLTTTEGYAVLKRGAGPFTNTDPAAESRKIAVGPGNVTFTSQGEVFQEGASLGQMSLVEFEDNQHLKKIGNSLYVSSDPNVPRVVNPQTEVMQGFIETSNVNIVKEMTDMIQASRAFETAQRVIKAYDEMDGKLINEVPKLG